MIWLKRLAIAVLASLATSCETTSSYGYYVEKLDEDSILLLFQLYDEALNERDYSTYESLVAPGFTIADKLDGVPSSISRQEHLEFVERTLATAKSLRVSTLVTSAQLVGPDSAVVVAQEDVRIETRHGPPRRVVTILEMDIGFDDGWIYIARMRRQAEQEYRE